MDVIDTRTYLSLEVLSLEFIQDDQVRTAGFKGDNVRIHVVDGWDDIGKFAVTHVGVDLRIWGNG